MSADQVPGSGPFGLPPLVRADGTPARAIVVDDEAALAAAVALALAADGWETRVETRGRDALIAMRDFLPDVVVLDIMMPGLDGFETLARIRAVRPDMRVLFLTALDEASDRLRGLRAGGDDYLAKPFDLLELQARVRALGRSAAAIASPAPTLIRAGEVVLDPASRSVRTGAGLVDLTATEFELLLLFAHHLDRVLRRPQILEAVWGFDYGDESNLVEVYVGSLRRKLAGEPSARIETVRGVGYALRTATNVSAAQATETPETEAPR